RQGSAATTRRLLKLGCCSRGSALQSSTLPLVGALHDVAAEAGAAVLPDAAVADRGSRDVGAEIAGADLPGASLSGCRAAHWTSIVIGYDWILDTHNGSHDGITHGLVVGFIWWASHGPRFLVKSSHIMLHSSLRGNRDSFMLAALNMCLGLHGLITLAALRSRSVTPPPPPSPPQPPPHSPPHHHLRRGDITVFIDNLPDQPFGCVKDVYIPTKRGKTRTIFGFVRFDSEVSTGLAVLKVDGMLLKGKFLHVMCAAFGMVVSDFHSTKDRPCGREESSSMFPRAGEGCNVGTQVASFFSNAGAEASMVSIGVSTRSLTIENDKEFRNVSGLWIVHGGIRCYRLREKRGFCAWEFHFMRDAIIPSRHSTEVMAPLFFNFTLSVDGKQFQCWIMEEGVVLNQLMQDGLDLPGTCDSGQSGFGHRVHGRLSEEAMAMVDLQAKRGFPGALKLSTPVDGGKITGSSMLQTSFEVACSIEGPDCLNCNDGGQPEDCRKDEALDGRELGLFLEGSDPSSGLVDRGIMGLLVVV
ncbi:hypothetical protein Dimus_036494, partial [Dionaea muscipula]